ncbi:MAG: DUF3617 domain-containing protein [Croceibacterium sp.]
MRLMNVLPLVAGLALAACGSGDKAPAAGETVSADQVAARAAGAAAPRPGKYTSRMELLDFSMPGMPDAAKAQMQQAFASGLAQGNEFCMTAEQADPRQMLQNMAESKCSFSRFDVDGGKIDADMSCTGDDGIASTVQMQGQMTADSSTMTMAMQRSMEGIGKMQMKMRVTSQRTGDCS